MRFVVGPDGRFDTIGPLANSEIVDEKEGEPAETTHRMEPGFLIRRIMPPPEMLRHHPSDSAAVAAIGEDFGWGFATPWVFRALNSPLTYEPILSAPQVKIDPNGYDPAPHAYWTSLLSLLLYCFGWARPDRGLRWWYDAGKPTDDPRLRLIAQVWDADGQLDWFAAWLWTWRARFKIGDITELTGYQSDLEPVDVDQRWIESVRSQAHAFGFGKPFGSGGWDHLHLTYHCNGPLERSQGAAPTLVRGPAGDRRAVLLLDSMVGWYRALLEQGATLPDLGNRSWHVDVVVRPVGLLGTYRRSRATGLWFAGRHSLHSRGT